MTLYAQVVLTLAAYLLGGVSFAYWLVRIKTGSDVREQGSGSTGATNVGRILGPRGFVIVLAFDIAKGALAVAAAVHWLNAPSACAAFVATAVVIGHIWPIQLKFHGGKGIGPLIGAWLVLSPESLLPVLALTILAFAILRTFTISGLIGLTLLPPSAWWFSEQDAVTASIALLTLLIILYAHRDNILQFKQKIKPTHDARHR